MRNKHPKINSDFRLIFLIYILSSILSLFLLKYFQYPINSDGISYLSIAQHYANGNFNNAINGYWGPLLSWIISPFLIFKLTPVDTLLVGEIISVIIGFFTLIGVKSLSYKFEMTDGMRTIILFAMIPVILFFWLRAISPDLLILCFFVYYLNIIFSPNYSDTIKNGIFAGILGAMAFLSKSYALPFFIFHFILFNLLHYWKYDTKIEKKKVLKNLSLGLMVFFLISGLWVGAISDKYGKITLGTSGEYNRELMGPGSLGHPVFFKGLIKPPNTNAISAWEDPFYIKMDSWDPLKSKEGLNNQLKLIWKNTHDTFDIIVSFSYLSLIIILGYVLLLLRSSKKEILKGNELYPILTIAIYTAGYILIWVEDRYLWLIYILLFLMGGFLVSKIFKNTFFNKKDVRYAVIVLFIWSFLVIPATNFAHIIQNDVYTEGVYDLSQDLKMQYNVHGNIASNDKWQKSLYVSFYLSSKYYGQVKSNSSDSELRKELESNNINYYFVWGDSKSNSELLSNYKEITGGKIKDLKVYIIKEDK